MTENGKISKYENFPKKVVGINVYRLMDSCKISKKSIEPILSNTQKVDFWTKNQQKWRKSAKPGFSQKWRLEKFIPFDAF